MQPKIHFLHLKLIKQYPTWTQPQLVESLGVNLGKTNYGLKALKDKDWVMWGNFSQNLNKLSYIQILIPQGIAQKPRHTTHFLHRKEVEYDRLRTGISTLYKELRTRRPTPAVNRIIKK